MRSIVPPRRSRCTASSGRSTASKAAPQARAGRRRSDPRVRRRKQTLPAPARRWPQSKSKSASCPTSIDTRPVRFEALHASADPRRRRERSPCPHLSALNSAGQSVCDLRRVCCQCRAPRAGACLIAEGAAVPRGALHFPKRGLLPRPIRSLNQRRGSMPVKYTSTSALSEPACGTPKTSTGVPATSPAVSAARPLLVVMSIRLRVITPFERSIRYTSVADWAVVLTSTVAGIVPPSTVMAKELPAKALVTTPSGSGVGISTAFLSDQPPGFAASPQVAPLTPNAVSAPTVPPKFTPPLVAATNAGMALAPLVPSVGKVRSHHLKPMIGLPLASVPLAVALEM